MLIKFKVIYGIIKYYLMAPLLQLYAMAGSGRVNKHSGYFTFVPPLDVSRGNLREARDASGDGLLAVRVPVSYQQGFALHVIDNIF